MTSATLGFAFSIEREALHSPDLRAEALRLVASSSWGRPLRYFSSIAVSGQKKVRRPGLLPTKERDRVYTDILATDATNTVDMASSVRSDGDYAHFSIDTQVLPWSAKKTKVYGLRPWEPAVTHSQWLTDVLEFADRAPANQGVVFAMATHTAAMSEAWPSNIILPHGGDAHPRPDQISSMSVNQKEMGSRYVRFPRWGTFYSRAYLAQLGGTDRIVELVRPAVVRELAAGIYFQLTDSFESALSDEALAKQHAFEVVAEPLLPTIG